MNDGCVFLLHPDHAGFFAGLLVGARMPFQVIPGLQWKPVPGRNPPEVAQLHDFGFSTYPQREMDLMGLLRTHNIPYETYKVIDRPQTPQGTPS